MTDNRFAEGMKVRRAVLGDAHVDRAQANSTELDRDFQAQITRSAWGEVWTRPGLDLRTRHLLTLSTLATLGHQEELAMHLRATVNTGVTPSDVKEVLMHLAVYAGVPVANAAFRTAKEVLGNPWSDAFNVDGDADADADDPEAPSTNPSLAPFSPSEP